MNCPKHSFFALHSECPHCRDEADLKSLQKEVAAWRERFPKLYYHSTDDCIDRREPNFRANRPDAIGSGLSEMVGRDA